MNALSSSHQSRSALQCAADFFRTPEITAFTALCGAIFLSSGVTALLFVWEAGHRFDIADAVFAWIVGSIYTTIFATVPALCGIAYLRRRGWSGDNDFALAGVATAIAAHIPFAMATGGSMTTAPMISASCIGGAMGAVLYRRWTKWRADKMAL